LDKVDELAAWRKEGCAGMMMMWLIMWEKRASRRGLGEGVEAVRANPAN